MKAKAYDSLLFLLDGDSEYAQYFCQKGRMPSLQTLVYIDKIVGCKFLETDQFRFRHFLQHKPIVCSKSKN